MKKVFILALTFLLTQALFGQSNGGYSGGGGGDSAQVTENTADITALEGDVEGLQAEKANKAGVQYLTLAPTASDTSNGTALLAAYASAEGMSPAAGNEVTLILPPATYDLGAGTLNMTTEYINVYGQIPVAVVHSVYRGAEPTGDHPEAIIKSSGTAINSTVGNATVAFVEVQGEVFTADTKDALWHDVWFVHDVDKNSASSNTFLRVYAASRICADPDFTYSGQNTFSGKFISSYGSGEMGWGGGGEMSGLVSSSKIEGDYVVGADEGTMSGVVEHSTVIGGYCLGGSYGYMTGRISDSTIGGYNCLGGQGEISGTISRCDISGPGQMESATISSNAVFSFSTGIDSGVTNSSASVFNCSDQNNDIIPNQ